jgi:hypothetical protein
VAALLEGAGVSPGVERLNLDECWLDVTAAANAAVAAAATPVSPPATLGGSAGAAVAGGGGSGGGGTVCGGHSFAGHLYQPPLDAGTQDMCTCG